MSIHDFLTASAGRYPDKTAVVHNARRITFAELDLQSDLLAGHLVEAGVRPGDRAVLFIDNSIEYVVAYFSIMKAGAAVVAMNVQMVPREIAYLVDDCSPVVVVTAAAHADHIHAAVGALPKKPRVVTVDGIVGKSTPSSVRHAARATDTDLACIIYTSGTTGKPKGVMLTHANLSANAESIVAYLGLQASDSVMVVLPFFYSYGHSLLTTHMKVGGTLVIDNRFLYPNVILDTMAKEKVTGFAGVPSHYAILLRKSALRQRSLPHLRYVTQAGGAMSPEMAREFSEVLPHVSFFVMYGQTEASARLSYLAPEFLHKKYGSIGKAIPGVELAVLSDNGEPVRPGETGEIVARGPNIMSGYWKADDETAKVLKNGWLYTGDLAKIDEDGFIYIVSRKKDMIKSGANRISPLEIEDVVIKMPHILECAAVGVPDDILGESILLCVVPVEGAVIDDKEVLSFCRQNLSAYKVPKRIRIMASLPKTPSGKVKRAALSADGEAVS